MIAASDMIRDLANRASRIAYNSALYNWSLASASHDRLIVLPPDGWPGSAERGRALTSAHPGNAAHWDAPLHGFDFLRDLRALGGDAARLQARGLIENWVRTYPAWDEHAWSHEGIGLRLSNWIGLFPFYGQSADQPFQDLVIGSIARQAKHLARALPGTAMGLQLLRSVRGLAYAGLALEGRESWLVQALDLLEKETARQILADGGHISRSPLHLVEALRIHIDVRNALRAGRYPVPEAIEHTIDRMAQALRFFRGNDKRLALFNGAVEGDDYLLDTVMLQSNARGRPLRHLPQSGYERLALGRTVVTVDAGTPPPHDHDVEAHAAPLAFEFAYGKERIFVSCGAAPRDPAWNAMLRGTAAHNTVCLDHRNVAEIRADGHLGRKVRKVQAERQEDNGALLLDMSHDGYVPLNGVTHRRRLFLADQGHDFRGEDNLTCAVGINKPIEVHLRFHLHPKVQASVIRDGQAVLLRLPGGSGWRFMSGGGLLTLEDSIYCGDDGNPRKTRQIVVSGVMDSDKASLKWALQREGLQ